MKKIIYPSLLMAALATLAGCSTSYSNSGLPPMNHSPQNTHFVSVEDMKGDTFTIRIKHPDKNIRITEEITIDPSQDFLHQYTGENMDYAAAKTESKDENGNSIDPASFFGLAFIKTVDEEGNESGVWSGFSGGVPTDVAQLENLKGQSATYRGKAMGTLDRNSGEIYEGEFEATIDFEAGNGGKLTGLITGDDERGFGKDGISMDGNVNGQFVEGEVSLNKPDENGLGDLESEFVPDNGSFWGQLSGKDASDLSGHYESNSEDGGMVGSFGGSRDELIKTPEIPEAPETPETPQ